MNYNIVQFDKTMLHLLPHSQQPFDIIGRLVPTYDGTEWKTAEQLIYPTKEKTYPDESFEPMEYIENPEQSAFLAMINDECVGSIRVCKRWSSLSNDEFINVFIKLQHLIISMYEDIEKDPLAWGFPEEPKTKALDYHRLTETLFALMTNGEYSENSVKIDTTLFLKAIKSFKNMEQTLKSLEKFGFSINNFNKRTSDFAVSHTNNELLHWSVFLTVGLRTRLYKPMK